MVKYILKAIKYQNEKVLANTPLLFLVKGGFFKSGSCVYLKFDHMKQSENTVRQCVVLVSCDVTLYIETRDHFVIITFPV